MQTHVRPRTLVKESYMRDPNHLFMFFPNALLVSLCSFFNAIVFFLAANAPRKNKQRMKKEGMNPKNREFRTLNPCKGNHFYTY
jgi:hypothetical protein